MFSLSLATLAVLVGLARISSASHSSSLVEDASRYLGEMTEKEALLEDCVSGLRQLKSGKSAKLQASEELDRIRMTLTISTSSIDLTTVVPVEAVDAVSDALNELASLKLRLEKVFPDSFRKQREEARQLELEYGHLQWAADSSVSSRVSGLLFKPFTVLVQIVQALIVELDEFLDSELPGKLLLAAGAADQETQLQIRTRLMAVGSLFSELTIFRESLSSHPRIDDLQTPLNRLSVQTAVLRHAIWLNACRQAADSRPVDSVEQRLRQLEARFAVFLSSNTLGHEAGGDGDCGPALEVEKASLKFALLSLYSTMVASPDKRRVWQLVQRLGPLDFDPVSPAVLQQLADVKTQAGRPGATRETYMRVRLFAVLALAVDDLAFRTSYEAVLARASATAPSSLVRRSPAPATGAAAAETGAQRVLSQRNPRCLKKSARMQQEIKQLLAALKLQPETAAGQELLAALQAKEKELKRDWLETAKVMVILDEVQEMRKRIEEMTSEQRRASLQQVSLEEEREMHNMLTRLMELRRSQQLCGTSASKHQSLRVRRVKSVVDQLLLDYGHLLSFSTEAGMDVTLFASFDAIMKLMYGVLEILQDFQDHVPHLVENSGSDIRPLITSWHQRIAMMLRSLHFFMDVWTVRPDFFRVADFLYATSVHVATLDHIKWVMATPETPTAATQYCAEQLDKLERELALWETVSNSFTKRRDQLHLHYRLLSLQSNLQSELSGLIAAEDLQTRTQATLARLGQPEFDAVTPEILQRLRHAQSACCISITENNNTAAQLRTNYTRLKLLGMHAMAVDDAQLRATFARNLRLAKARLTSRRDSSKTTHSV